MLGWGGALYVGGGIFVSVTPGLPVNRRIWPVIVGGGLISRVARINLEWSYRCNPHTYLIISRSDHRSLGSVKFYLTHSTAGWC